MLLLTLLACADPGPPVALAEPLGFVEQSADIQGRDGGMSVLAWGRSNWIFGDTVLNVEDALSHTWHHNSVSWTEDLDAADGITGFTEPLDAAGAPAHLIPPSEAELEFNLAHYGDPCAETPCGARWAVWPGTAVVEPISGDVLVFYGLIYAEPGSMNFEGVGASIARWTGPDALPERPIIDPDAEHPDLMWGQEELSWGVGAVIEGEHLVALACDQDGLGHVCRVGRAPSEQAQDPTAWRYWDGEVWGEDQHAAADLFDGAPIQSLSWSAHHGAWLVIYSHPFSREVVARTAPELTGPWSAESRLFKVEGDAPYDVVHYPEYAEDGGRVQYLSYSRGTEEAWFSTERPLWRVSFR